MSANKALRLALEALKEDRAWLETDAPTEVWEKNNEAITAIKAALEAKDEPVAWYVERQHEGFRDHGLKYGPFWKRDDALEWCDYNHFLKNLYTTPPQRTWVGLTDEDKQKLAAEQHDWEGLCFAVEARLKEKNCG